jgi:hypothetical protein
MYIVDYDFLVCRDVSQRVDYNDLHSVCLRLLRDTVRLTGVVKVAHGVPVSAGVQDVVPIIDKMI